MTISIQRLELKDGRVFQVAGLFPGDTRIKDPAEQHKQVVVGPIFLIPQVTESVEFESDEPDKPTNGSTDDSDDDEDDSETQLHEVPSYYEVWCVNEALYTAFFGGFKHLQGMQVDQAAIRAKMVGTTTMRLVVWVTSGSALGHYEEWPTVLAFEAMMDRMKQQQQQQSAPPPAANGGARVQAG